MSLFTTADVETLKRRLAPIQSRYFPTVQLDDADLLAQLKAAERTITSQLKVKLQPTTIFPYTPSQAEIDALPAGEPWDEEPGYDYSRDFFTGDKWGYLLLRSRPAIEVKSIKFSYPAPTNTVHIIPNDWIRLDKKYGHVRLVPASAAFAAPFGAFLLAALGAGRAIPSMIQVIYRAGLTDVRERWPHLLEVIYQQASLTVIKSQFLPLSGSISGDGLSQSFSFDGEKHEGLIQTALFGPKGSNGGLWTEIHGIGVGVVGPVP